MRRVIALLTLVMILALVNWSIMQKERHISNGQTLYIKLAPVDPRSLMQGDYMALRFELANRLARELSKKDREESQTPHMDGYLVVTLDRQKIASYGHIFDENSLDANQTLLHYRFRAGRVKFATNAYFFEEGSAEKYAKARYGEFRVNQEGELLLVAMARDENGTVVTIE